MSKRLSLQDRAKNKHVNEKARERLIQLLRAMKLELKYRNLLERQKELMSK